MASITLQGNPMSTIGELPAVGSQAPQAGLTDTKLADINIADYAGKRLVLNIFPSIDTPTCATSVRQFNEKAASVDNVAVLCVSADLPFAMARFCGAEGIENVESASTFRSDFADKFGVTIKDGPLAGLTSRAVVVLDVDGKVIHTEQVAEIADEPNYEAALSVL